MHSDDEVHIYLRYDVYFIEGYAGSQSVGTPALLVNFNSLDSHINPLSIPLFSILRVDLSTTFFHSQEKFERDNQGMAGGGGCGDRERLHGFGNEILVLVVTGTTRQQLTEWLTLPLKLAEEEADLLLRPTECCQIRRQGEALLQIVVERATPEQWYKWLQIPLECARRNSQLALEGHLLSAGARENPTRFVCHYEGKSSVARGDSSSQGSPPPVDSCCKSPKSPTSEKPTSEAATSTASRVAAPSSPNARSLDTGASSPSFCCGETPKKCSVTVKERNSSTRLMSSSSSAGFHPSSRSADDNLPIIDRGAGALIEGDKLALHRATMARDLPRMRKLLADGVNLNAKDLWSCTALHRASEQNIAEPVRLLIAAGINIGARDMEGYTALHFASARGSEEAIVHLLAAGASLNDRGLNGDTPLHSAVRFLSLSTARMLLEADADEQATNNDGETPLQVIGVLPDGREIENHPDPLTAQGIRHLLFAAPARRRFRIWKRRAWLVMLRTRVHETLLEEDPCSQLIEEKCGDAEVNAVTEAVGEVKMTSSCQTGNGSGVECSSSVDGDALGGDSECAPDVVGGAAQQEEDGTQVDAPENHASFELITRTAGLPEDGLFQAIVRYL